MSLGRPKREKQNAIWIDAVALPQRGGYPFYEHLNKHGFDRFAEQAGAPFYPRTGRPALVPGVYFRLLLVGYCAGLDSERSIGWRAADTLALWQFLGYELSEATPNHSTISRTRRLTEEETHRDIFGWVLRVLAEQRLLKGNTVATDGTTMKANPALRSIVKRDSGEAYNQLLEWLARESGIETPTREQMAKLARKRPEVPTRIGKTRMIRMRGSRRSNMAPRIWPTRPEHAVDLETGAVVAITLQPATAGDTQTVCKTLCEVGENICEAAVTTRYVTQDTEGPIEAVLDNDYDSNDFL